VKANSTKTQKRDARKTTKARTARVSTKKTLVPELLRREEGATIVVIGKATHWQNHTIRGFISGTVTKKMGLASNRQRTRQENAPTGSLSKFGNQQAAWKTGGFFVFDNCSTSSFGGESTGRHWTRHRAVR
jgi:hypothetical protein